MPASASAGFLGSLQQLGDSLVCAVQARVELLSTELQEEKFRVLKSLVLIGAAIFTGAMMFTFASVAVVYALPERARLIALIIITLLYAVAFVAIFVSLRRYLAGLSRPFEDTIQELTVDRGCFQPRK
ncbi:MAG: phage holin family protein [Verrucomicrobiota bacterium]|nr:phage holin family protein [Verrucomicrobiota bacterium]